MPLRSLCFEVSVIVKLPQLKQHKEQLRRFCLERRLVEKSAVSESGDRTLLVELSSREKLQVSEEDTVHLLLQGTEQLLRAERLLEQGAPVEEALWPTEAWEAAGQALQELFAMAVGQEELMQRLAGAILVASEAGSFREAAKLMEAPQDLEKLRLQRLGGHSILFYSMLCYAILFYAMLCYAILCYAMLCYAMLFYSILFYSIPFHSILFYSILFYYILFYSMVQAILTFSYIRIAFFCCKHFGL